MRFLIVFFTVLFIMQTAPAFADNVRDAQKELPVNMNACSSGKKNCEKAAAESEAARKEFYDKKNAPPGNPNGQKPPVKKQEQAKKDVAKGSEEDEERTVIRSTDKPESGSDQTFDFSQNKPAPCNSGFFGACQQ